MRTIWSGFQLRMRLGGNEERMIRDLDHLHDSAVRGNAGEHHAVIAQCLPVIVVDLVAVSVALVDDFLAVKGISLGILIQDTGVGAQP